MTFYNIIFGILFLGVFREVLIELPYLYMPKFWQLSTLAVIIFSDVVYTSHTIEELKRPYSIWMKLLDLCNFVILSVALLSLNPSPNNFLQVQLDFPLNNNLVPPWFFWGLLLIYWAIIIVWLGISDIHPDSKSIYLLSRDHKWLRSKWTLSIFTFIALRSRLLTFSIYIVAFFYAVFQPYSENWLASSIFWFTSFFLLVNGFVFSIYKAKSEINNLLPERQRINGRQRIMRRQRIKR